MSAFSQVSPVLFGILLFVVPMLIIWYFSEWKPDHHGRSVFNRAAARRARIAALEHVLFADEHGYGSPETCPRCREIVGDRL